MPPRRLHSVFAARWAAAAVILVGAVTLALWLLGGSLQRNEGRASDPMVQAGAAVAQSCRVCHTFDRGGPYRVGPNLWGVVGAPKARWQGFAYSRSLRDAGGVWDEAELTRYLADPGRALPGTTMDFSGISDEQDLAALIAYLRSLKD